MSYGTGPSPGTSTSRSAASRKLGTLRSVTERARPPWTATRASTSPAGVSSRTTVTGSRAATMPVSTSTVATPIVPCPHIGRQPETSMNSTPQSASGRAGGCRLAHEQEPQVVHLGLEVQLALEHRRARDRLDAGRHDARRHPLRVRVDGLE